SGGRAAAHDGLREGRGGAHARVESGGGGGFRTGRRAGDVESVCAGRGGSGGGGVVANRSDVETGDGGPGTGDGGPGPDDGFPAPFHIPRWRLFLNSISAGRGKSIYLGQMMSICPGQRCPSILDNDVHLSWTTMSICPGQRCPSILDERCP